MISADDVTLQRVADAVVDVLGFGAATVNLARPEAGVLEVVAIAGPQEARDKLLGVRIPTEVWLDELERSQPWGQLRFFAAGQPAGGFPAYGVWTPTTVAASDDPGSWQTGDELYAVLRSRDGELLGALSVDLPPEGRRPDAKLCRALEALVMTASLVIEQTRLHQRARASAQLLRTLLDSSPLGLALLDRAGRPVTVNPAYEQLVDGASEQVVAAAFAHGVQAVPSLTRRDDGGELLIDGGGDGDRRRWLRARVVALAEESDHATHLLEVEDVTERRRTARRLRYQAEHDPLTRLPNRAQVLDALRRALASHAVDGRPFAVLYCDLDRFKSINDVHGHPAGDGYLLAVSQRLSSRRREGDVLGRFGGDEFVVVSAPLETPEVADAMAARLVEAVGEPLEVHGEVYVPSISIGVALVTGTDDTADGVLQRADRALYAVKGAGGNAWHRPLAV